MVVIQGTGGVSLFGLQIAKMMGAQVILMSSTDEKLALARSLGADHLVNYRSSPAWDARGADVIVEIGGADTFQRSLNAAKLDGHIGIIGVRSGFGLSPTVPREQILIRNLTLRGLTVGSVRELECFCAALEAHRPLPVVDRTFAFDEAEAAVAHLRAQQHVGKIAIQIAN